MNWAFLQIIKNVIEILIHGKYGYSSILFKYFLIIKSIKTFIRNNLLTFADDLPTLPALKH